MYRGALTIVLGVLTLVGAVPGVDPTNLVALRHLVPASDPLATHDLQFDARFADAAVAYVRTPTDEALQALAAQPAALHLLAHARQFAYDVPKESSLALVRHLFAAPAAIGARVDLVERSRTFFLGPMLSDPRWVEDVLRYLPEDFRFRGSLFLTFGYDIGVALAPNASLNGAHPHFDGHSRELLYYAIHELHHVGYQTYRRPPSVADLKTCEDVLRLVNDSTQLEGMGVLVARSRRAADRALHDDADYVALEDAPRMEQLEARYFQDYDYLTRRGREPADQPALAVIEHMSSGDRLWYRVGARMAAHIERERGRQALIDLITRPEPTFVATYRQLVNQRYPK